MNSIHARPKHILRRKEAGHWERDTMFGANRETAFVCIERKSRYLLIRTMKQPYTKNLATEQRKLLRNFDVKTMTNDNGNEFMDGKTFKAPVYYCDPHSPHQKGSVENAIGLLRQYLPRNTDLKKLTTQAMIKIQNNLNHRPRKCLNYLTPHEVMFGESIVLGL